jgi:hypothetical protein
MIIENIMWIVMYEWQAHGYKGLTLWSRDLCLLFSLGSNSFIGDQRNHV